MTSEKHFTAMDFDAIGEILNISMGSAATAISSMLDRRVDITTPNVEMRKASEVYIEDLEPSFGVKITYIEGINGTNVMVLKKRDVNAIINIMTSGMLGEDPDGELDEMGTSAICEVMNQMMGSSATALSDFLGKVVNISTPEPLAVAPGEAITDNDPEEQLVMVNFLLTIEGVMESRFVSLMSCELVEEMTQNLYKMMGTSPAPEEPVVQTTAVTQEAAVSAPTVVATPVSEAPAQPAAVEMPSAPPVESMQVQPQMQQPVAMEVAAVQQPTMPQQVPMAPMDPAMAQMNGQQMPYGVPPQGYGMYYPQGYGMYPPGYGTPYGGAPQGQQTAAGQGHAPKAAVKSKQEMAYSQARPVELTNFDDGENYFLDSESPENLDLIRSVPLEISVEIGRATRKVKEILEFTQGTVVELDKQAGAQVDIIVNGHPIAKGDVVVIGDNFGVRITEILKREELSELQ